MTGGPLNLTDFEEPKGFEAVPPGKYYCTVYDAEDRKTQGGEGSSMPAETPYIFLHFQVTDGKVGDDLRGEESPYDNKRFFRNLMIPPADYLDKRGTDKARKAMNGMLVSFFRAVGYSEEEIISGEFNVEAQDLIERTLVVQVNRGKNKQTEEFENKPVAFFSNESVSGESTSTTAAVI